MTDEMKNKLFSEMLRLESLGGKVTYDNRDYFEQANGAYMMLKVLGIDKEYIRWAIGKEIS